jgi:hypothetical protein
MRASLWFGLLALGLIAASIRMSTASPQRPRGVRSAPPPAAEPTWEVTGHYLRTPGEAKEEACKRAQEDALKRASTSVVAYLDKTYGRLNWNPTLDQLTEAGVVRLEGEPKQKDELVEARARVTITAPYRQEVERQAQETHRLARQQRSQHRHVLLARVLAGLVVLCVVVAGYLRLEDLTRGYYTSLLRLAALAVLAGTAAALTLVAF